MSDKNKDKLAIKDAKFLDGHKKHVILQNAQLICDECGAKISQREQHRNGGLCDGCFGLN